MKMLSTLSQSIVQIATLLSLQSSLISAIVLDTSSDRSEPLSKRTQRSTSSHPGVQFSSRPTEPPKCPLPPPYGKPHGLDCQQAWRWMEEDSSNKATVYQTRVWARLQGIEEESYSRPEADYLLTSRIWSFGTCAIHVDLIPRRRTRVLADIYGFLNGQGGVTQDISTKNVVKRAAKSVLDNCVNAGPRVGGTADVGYFSSIRVTVYEQRTDPARTAQVNSALVAGSCETKQVQAGNDVSTCSSFGGTSASNDNPDSGPSGMDTSQYALLAGAAACKPNDPDDCGWGSECRPKQSSLGSVLWGKIIEFGSCIDVVNAGGS